MISLLLGALYIHGVDDDTTPIRDEGYLPLPSYCLYYAVIWLSLTLHKFVLMCVYRQLTNGQEESFAYDDTFLDAAHVKASFPDLTVEFLPSSSHQHLLHHPVEQTVGTKGSKGKAKSTATAAAAAAAAASAVISEPPPPYHVTVKPQAAAAVPTPVKKGAKKAAIPSSDATSKAVVVVRPVSKAPPGPYPEDQPPSNPIRFTPVQVEAIRSGMNQGLTLIVGPPGTGKHDAYTYLTIAFISHNYDIFSYFR